MGNKRWHASKLRWKLFFYSNDGRKLKIKHLFLWRNRWRIIMHYIMVYHLTIAYVHKLKRNKKNRCQLFSTGDNFQFVHCTTFIIYFCKKVLKHVYSIVTYKTMLCRLLIWHKLILLWWQCSWSEYEVFGQISVKRELVQIFYLPEQ